MCKEGMTAWQIRDYVDHVPGVPHGLITDVKIMYATGSIDPNVLIARGGATADSKMFPILLSCSEMRTLQKAGIECPKHVPWSLVEPREAQALHNHDQTLVRLAQRGGLGMGELLCVLEGWPLKAVAHQDTVGCARKLLKKLDELCPKNEEG
jgi:hypothetical protein